jgi:hypothetical protein
MCRIIDRAHPSAASELVRRRDCLPTQYAIEAYDERINHGQPAVRSSSCGFIGPDLSSSLLPTPTCRRDLIRTSIAVRHSGRRVIEGFLAPSAQHGS